jgi:hypothetical protein
MDSRIDGKIVNSRHLHCPRDVDGNFWLGSGCGWHGWRWDCFRLNDEIGFTEKKRGMKML